VARKAGNIIDEAGICHHEFGNLIVFNVIIWGLAGVLGLTLCLLGNKPRVYSVDGCKLAYDASPYYGLPDTWINTFLGKGKVQEQRKKTGE